MVMKMRCQVPSPGCAARRLATSCSPSRRIPCERSWDVASCSPSRRIPRKWISPH